MRTASSLLLTTLLLASPATGQSASDSIAALVMTTDEISASVPGGFSTFCVESLPADDIDTPGGRAGNWTEIGPEIAEAYAREIAQRTGVEAASACLPEAATPQFLVTPYRVHFA